MNSRPNTLPFKHRQFADLYAGGPDNLRGNAAKCYKHIHPQCKESTAETNGPRLLRNTQVQAYLHEKADRIQEETDINAQWHLDQAVKYLDICMGRRSTPKKVCIPGPDGKIIETEVEVLEFNPAGAARALDLIGKNILVHAFKERVETSSNFNLAAIMAKAQERVERAFLDKNPIQ